MNNAPMATSSRKPNGSHDTLWRKCLVDQLRSAIEEMRLTASERTYAQAQLKSVQAALSAASPDKKAAEHLRGFTATIKEAGELATAGSAVASAIGNIAAWFGTVGVGILSLL